MSSSMTLRNDPLIVLFYVVQYNNTRSGSFFRSTCHDDCCPIVGDLKSCFVQKYNNNTNIAPERYTAGFLYTDSQISA